MGMVMRNHELVESGTAPYGFAPGGEDLDPSVNLAGEAVMEDIISTLMGLSLSVVPNLHVRFSPIIPTAGAAQTLSVVSTG
ncbi:hypothetical protein AYI68_g7137, partial [Smittium mucronatum]